MYIDITATTFENFTRNFDGFLLMYNKHAYWGSTSIRAGDLCMSVLRFQSKPEGIGLRVFRFLSQASWQRRVFLVAVLGGSVISVEPSVYSRMFDECICGIGVVIITESPAGLAEKPAPAPRCAPQIPCGLS